MIDIGLMIVLGSALLDSKAVNEGVNVTYTVDVDPETVAAYRRREEQLKLLRG